jgi:transketolase
MITYEDLLLRLVTEDERFMVVTAENRAAIRNLPDKIKERFIDVGIAEQTMTGMAAGLALRGRIPIIHALASFLTMRAFEFIRTDVGIANLPVKMIGAFAGFLSEANGPTHQSIEDVSIMRGIPNVNVFCPADLEDLIICLPDILKSPSAFYIRYTNRDPVISHNNHFQIGKAEIISEGRDLTIISSGILFAEAFLAKEILEQKGLSTGLINVRTPKPLDSSAVLKACRKSTLIVTIEDHFLTGGLYSIVAELLLQNKITYDVLPIALEHRWFKPALLNDVLEYEGFTGQAIAKKVFKKLDKNKQIAY